MVAMAPLAFIEKNSNHGGGPMGVMEAMAVRVDDQELERLLKHMGLPADLPKTKPSRGPPGRLLDEAGEVDPGLDEWDGKEQASGDD